MTKYSIGDMFEILDKDDYFFMDAIAVRIIAVYTKKKKGKSTLYYRINAIYGEPEDPLSWRMRYRGRRLDPDGISISRYKFGEFLREGKIKKMPPNMAAKILLWNKG